MSNLTQAGYERLSAELGELEARRIQAVMLVEEAQGAGDVAENPDVGIALAELARIDARVKTVQRTLRGAVVSDGAGGDVVEIGCVVTLSIDGDDDEIFFFGSLEDRREGFDTLTEGSDLGKIIKGKAVGDVCDSGRGYTIEIKEISAD